MKKNSYTLAQPCTHESTIEKSRFIAQLFPTDTINDAKNTIGQIKKQHPTASHNCWAYIIRNNTLIQKASDDGEPVGTAGKPMLQALTSRQMINVTAVVTRYFGGSKLGSGGLIRAYSHAVLGALDVAVFLTYQKVAAIIIRLSYEELNNMYRLQDQTRLFKIEAVNYDPHPTMQLTVFVVDIPKLKQVLQSQLLRSTRLEIIDEFMQKVPIMR